MSEYYNPQEPDNTPKKEKKKMNAFVKAFLCAVIVGVVAGSMVIGSFAIGSKAFGSSEPAQTQAPQTSVTTTQDALSTSEKEKPTATTASTAQGTYTVTEIAKNCKPCVVAITNKGVRETMTMFGTYQQESESAGSGVIISKNDNELMIVTNYHVIEGSDELSVCFNDSEDAVSKASIKGTDEENDLAVISVKTSDISKEVLDTIAVATIGDSDAMEVGDQVVAIGNALGSGQSVTSGCLSAKDREVVFENNISTRLLQTDAAINPGNSGGALFNMKGELIGINSSKYSETSVEGMGFAIPMSTAESIIQDLMNETSREKLKKGYGYLGIYGSDVDEATASSYGIPAGVYISEAIDGGAAQKAGLQKGDIITRLDKKTVTSMSSLKQKLQYYAAGETIEVTYSRSDNGEYKEHTAKVTLGNSDDAAKDEKRNAQSAPEGDQGQQGNPSGPSGNGGNGFFDFEW